MIRTTTLLFCALFLRGVEEAAAQRGRCVGGLCLFQDRLQFQTAKVFCSDKGGQLLERRPGDDLEPLTGLLGAVTGRFWLRGTGGTEAEKCPAVSVATGHNVTVVPEPCGEQLDGFVYQYGSEDMCSPVQGRAGVHVGYVFSQSFQMSGSETFPPGTVATAQEVDAAYPASKHLCFSAAWVPAPWGCEVLTGGCEHDCDADAKACVCPAASTIHPNNVSCVAQPCAHCEQGCSAHGHGHVCVCNSGHRLAPDGNSCVDVDECKEDPDACTNEGEECVNMRGRYECRCMDGFDEEDGACVNVSICAHCEHMSCPKIDGVHQCACREGFRVSPADPTKCVIRCTERDCPALCNPDPEREKKDMQQCFCPEGYITDIGNQTATCTDIDECAHQRPCDHDCENLYGSFRCTCYDGYALQQGGKCVRVQDEDEEEEEENGSGASTVRATPAAGQPASFPSYVKTGSVLGMSAFVVVLLALLACVFRHMWRRCSAFELQSFKHPDIDIFYLQQVTTETYKRLSFDKPSKSDAHRLSTSLDTPAAGT